MITIPGKIPISIHPLFWLIALFIAFMSSGTLAGTLLGVIVILVSVIVHEFGHALTGILFGQKTRIELAAFGGFTYRQGRKLKLWEEFIVVLNGPLAGFLLFLLARFVLHTFTIQNAAIDHMLKFTALVNFFWTIVNLIPVLPLDGGHLLSILLEAIFGFRGVKIAIVAGLVISVAVSVFFLAIGRFFIGALFLILTFESFRSLRYYKLLSEPDRDTTLQDLMKAADADFQEEKYEEALKKLEEVRTRAKEGILYTMAIQEIAEIYRHQHRYEEAYELLLPIEETLSGDVLSLFHFLAYANRDYKKVTKVGNQCYQTHPSYHTALINALAYGALAQPEPAVGWLECALREGVPSIRDVIKKPEFDPVRQDPKFQQFAQSLVS